jgi:hypothetical protein
MLSVGLADKKRAQREADLAAMAVKAPQDVRAANVMLKQNEIVRVGSFVRSGRR